MVYSIWLLALAAAFAVAERLWPAKPQRLFRRGILQDVFYLVFHGEYLGVLIGLVSIHAVSALEKSLDAAGSKSWLYLRLADGLPLAVQLPLLLLSFDLLQWLIHNLLHRVDWLWQFHKVHHCIEEMDWIGNWRFHWMEVVVYRSLLYVPAAVLGFGAPAMFWYGVLNTLAGHFAHSNLRVHAGPLRYVLNTPEMHLWHHAHPDAGPINRNFGIALSIWDWLFGTAYLPPGESPNRLGFAGIENYPEGIAGRMLAPFERQRK